MPSFMYLRDIALFVRSARTDARIAALRPTLGTAGALEAVYAANPDPWASAASRFRYQKRKYEVLTSLLPAGQFGRVLDLGCGTGSLSRHLAARAASLVGVDISPTAVAIARKRNADVVHTSYEVHDLLALPSTFDGTFDLVVLADVLYYLSPLDETVLAAVADRAARLLRPDGLCLLANHFVIGFDPDSRRSRKIHDAFVSSCGLELRSTYRRPFYLVTFLSRKTADRSPSSRA